MISPVVSKTPHNKQLARQAIAKREQASVIPIQQRETYNTDKLKATKERGYENKKDRQGGIEQQEGKTVQGRMPQK